jgi:hypothetical protein
MRVHAALAVCLLLIACGDKSDEDDDRKASGQVLEGTVSDAMLPLDTVSSQPPLAKETGSAGGGAPDADATDATEGEESPAADDAAAADDEG